MRRFLKRIVIYAVIVGVITGFCNALYVRAVRGTREEDKFLDVPYGIEICNLGSSHGVNAYRYEDTGDIVCFNFALGAQTLSYDLRIIEYYQSRLADGARVIITISPFSFYGKDETYMANFPSKNRRYYTFLPSQYIKEYDAKTSFYIKYLPLLAASIDSDITDLLNKMLASNNAEEEAELRGTTPEKAIADGMLSYNQYIVERQKQDGNMLYNQTEVEALYKIIELCQSKSFEPVMITTPFLNEFNDTVAENAPEFYENYYTIINEVITRTGVQYFDYSRDERFSEDYSLFKGDAVHMNKKGGVLFTKTVLQEVFGL